MKEDSANTSNRIAEHNGQLRFEFQFLNCPECQRTVTKQELSKSLWGLCLRCEDEHLFSIFGG